jgi:hypothetical protein
MKLYSLMLLLLLTCMASAHAKGVYQSSTDFIQQSLGTVPTPEFYWLSRADKNVIAQILQHEFNRLRIQYWRQGEDFVWILDEIGKEQPITVGIHIHVPRSLASNAQIVDVAVLTYRESRGGEVRHDFFTDQFKHSQLADDIQLNKSIDGITGATLSVRALTKTSRLALWLTTTVLNQDKR